MVCNDKCGLINLPLGCFMTTWYVVWSYQPSSRVFNDKYGIISRPLVFNAKYGLMNLPLGCLMTPLVLSAVL